MLYDVYGCMHFKALIRMLVVVSMRRWSVAIRREPYHPLPNIYIAKEVKIKQTTLNHKLCTEVSSELFYSLYIVLSYAHSLHKALWPLLSFVHIQKGYTPPFLVAYKACYVVFLSLYVC